MVWGELFGVVFPVVLTGLFAVFGWFYARNYREQREFRAHMYDITNELDKNLSNNCVLTQGISDVVRVIPDLRERVARLEGVRDAAS